MALVTRRSWAVESFMTLIFASRQSASSPEWSDTSGASSGEGSPSASSGAAEASKVSQAGMTEPYDSAIASGGFEPRSEAT